MDYERMFDIINASIRTVWEKIFINWQSKWVAAEVAPGRRISVPKCQTKLGRCRVGRDSAFLSYIYRLSTVPVWKNLIPQLTGRCFLQKTESIKLHCIFIFFLLRYFHKYNKWHYGKFVCLLKSCLEILSIACTAKWNNRVGTIMVSVT